MGKENKIDMSKYNTPFATRLRLLMKETGASQEKVGNAVKKSGGDKGITRQSVGAYTSGASLPDIETFQAIADFFGVSYDYLLGYSDSRTRENTDIANRTGLTDASIAVLEKTQDKLTFLRFINDLMVYRHLKWLVSSYGEYREIIEQPESYFEREERWMQSTGKVENPLTFDLLGRHHAEEYMLFKLQKAFTDFAESRGEY